MPEDVKCGEEENMGVSGDQLHTCMNRKPRGSSKRERHAGNLPLPQVPPLKKCMRLGKTHHHVAEMVAKYELNVILTWLILA